MGDTTQTADAVTVSILDKEYRVACAEDERAELQASARLLHERMARIRASGSVIGLERIAVMAALNIAHELIQAKADLARLPVEQEMVDRLKERVQSALKKIDQSER
jgi:cell division protein ZapA